MSSIVASVPNCPVVTPTPPNLPATFLETTMETEDQTYVVTRWVPPFCNNQLWSNVYDPVGAAFGTKKTCVEYHFTLLTEPISYHENVVVRLVLTWNDPEYLHMSQIGMMEAALFLNADVTVTKVSHCSDPSKTFAEGYSAGDFFRWNCTSREIMDCSLHPEMIGEEVYICDVGFSLTVNHDLKINKENVAKMILYNESVASLYCNETLENEEEDVEKINALAEKTYTEGFTAENVGEIMHGTNDYTHSMSVILDTHLEKHHNTVT